MHASTATVAAVYNTVNREIHTNHRHSTVATTANTANTTCSFHHTKHSHTVLQVLPPLNRPGPQGRRAGGRTGRFASAISMGAKRARLGRPCKVGWMHLCVSFSFSSTRQGREGPNNMSPRYSTLLCSDLSRQPVLGKAPLSPYNLW